MKKENMSRYQYLIFFQNLKMYSWKYETGNILGKINISIFMF